MATSLAASKGSASANISPKHRQADASTPGATGSMRKCAHQLIRRSHHPGDEPSINDEYVPPIMLFFFFFFFLYAQSIVQEVFLCRVSFNLPPKLRLNPSQLYMTLQRQSQNPNRYTLTRACLLKRQVLERSDALGN
jgi:hypothetical protein